MYVLITAEAVEIREADDLTRLSVRAPGLTEADAATCLARSGAGTVDETGHMFLNLAHLRRIAEASDTGPDWPNRWERMIDYARKNGWLTTDNQSVQAHLE